MGKAEVKVQGSKFKVKRLKSEVINITMKKSIFLLKWAYPLILLLMNITITDVSAQTGLTLEQALSTAETNSPTIIKTRLNLKRSQENLNAQNAALKSNFSLSINPINYAQNRAYYTNSGFNTTKDIQSSGSFTIRQPILFSDATLSLTNNFSYTNSILNEQFPTQEGAVFNNDLSINLTQPLFTYNRTKMSLKELKLSLENAQLNYAIQLLAMEKNVTQAFYAVYQAQQSLDIADQAYQNMLKSYEISKNKVNAGISAQSEMFQAELNLATTKSDYENKQVAYENAKDNFKDLVGITLYDDIIVIPNINVDTVNVDVAFAIDQGLANRMELRQSQISIETAYDNLIQTKALNEFHGSLTLSFGINGNNENLKDLYSDPRNNENVGLSFNIPLWDWGENKSRVKATEATIESDKVDLNVEQNNIILSVRQSFRNLKNLQNQIEIARQSVNNAQLTYDLNLEKYRNGDLTGMDLSIYQNQLSENKLNYTNALISYKLELLNLKIQTLYDFEKKQPVIPVKTLQQ
jgi:outer membrane protein